MATDIGHQYPGWSADAPAALVRHEATLAAHTMSAWAIHGTPPYDLPQCACATCDYWMLAGTDDGELVYTPTVGERPGVGYVDALRIVSPCRHPLPQLFAGTV